MRTMNVPPVWRAYSQLNSADRMLPTCGSPVGLGAYRTRTVMRQLLVEGRNGASLSMSEESVRVCIQTSPLPVNFSTSPSPPAMSDPSPPTLPTEYCTLSVKATTCPVSTTSSLPGWMESFLMAHTS